MLKYIEILHAYEYIIYSNTQTATYLGNRSLEVVIITEMLLTYSCLARDDSTRLLGVFRYTLAYLSGDQTWRYDI